MSDTYSWIRLIHFLGLFLWVGGLLAVTQALSGLSGVSKDALSQSIETASRLERRLLLPGFVLALLSGVYMLIYSVNVPLKQGWMHGKLLMIVFLVGVQGLLGAKRAALRKGGDPDRLSKTFRLLFFLTALLALVVLVLVVHKPGNRAILPT